MKDDTQSKKVTTNDEVTQTDKVTKLSLKSVDNILGNLDGFSPEEQNQIISVMEKQKDKGRVTSGQGGGSSYDTEEMTTFRNDFFTMSDKLSVGNDITKSGVKLPYIIDNRGVKRYPMLYFRSVKDKTTKQ